MEKVRTKTIAGRKVKEFEFTGEVKFTLRIADAESFDGKEVCLLAKVPVTNGIEAIFELEKTHKYSGNYSYQRVESNIVYFYSKMIYDTFEQWIQNRKKIRKTDTNAINAE